MIMQDKNTCRCEEWRNSHMIMQDKNHLQVADFILQWIDQRVSKPSGAKK